MILSNLEIQKAIDEGRLRITPDPQPRSPEYPDCPYNTTAVDLHLGEAIAIPKEGPFNYDLRKGGFATFLATNSLHKQLTEDGYVLEPKKFVLGLTMERVTLPIAPGNTLAARIEGKSSIARCGLLVHLQPRLYMRDSMEH